MNIFPKRLCSHLNVLGGLSKPRAGSFTPCTTKSVLLHKHCVRTQVKHPRQARLQNTGVVIASQRPPINTGSAPGRLVYAWALMTFPSADGIPQCGSLSQLGVYRRCQGSSTFNGGMNSKASVLDPHPPSHRPLWRPKAGAMMPSWLDLLTTDNNQD